MKNQINQNPKIYSVYDSKGLLYQLPFYSASDATAQRSWAANIINDPNSGYAQFPEDYTLFCIGEFDDSTGSLIPCTPRSIITALTLVAMRDLSLKNRQSLQTQTLGAN